MRLPRTVTMAAGHGEGRPLIPGFGSPRFGRVLAAALAVVVLGLVLGLTIGLRGQASDRSAAPAGLPSLLRQAGPLVVFSEFGFEADTLWAADPDDPAERIQLGLVEHAQGYAIFPSLSPDGARVAYTVLPPDGAQPGSDATAELWVLETATGVTLRLAGAVDLLVTPLWSPAGDAVVVRRSAGGDGSDGGSLLLRVDLSGAVTTVLEAPAALFPVDVSPDGVWLYFAVLSAEGTDLARAPVLGGGEAEAVAHLSDGFARDWHLSPDGTRLAYLAQPSEETGMAFEARVLELSTGTQETPLNDAAVSHFSPVWDQDGGLTIGRLAGTGGASGAAVQLSAAGAVVASALAAPTDPGSGFDVPLTWSPDGTHLVVRSFAGASVADPGPSQVVVLGTDGERRTLSQLSDVAVAGWLSPPE